MLVKRGFGKKGASHFEMVISFVFFIGFVTFLFIFIKPYNTTTLSGSVVAGLYDSFKENAETNLTNVFLKADYTGTEHCFYVQLPDRIFHYAMTQSYVTNLSDVEKTSELDKSGDLNIVHDSTVYYKVAISPDFADGLLKNCEPMDNYVLGSLLERKVVSYKTLEEMSNKYFDDYEGLRNDLKVPAVFDFSIVCDEFDEINMKKISPDSEDVMTYSYIMEVLKDGEVTNARFIFGVW